MFNTPWQTVKSACSLLTVLTLLLGLIYPLIMTRLGQALFPYQANGSLINQGSQPIGSRLIGQSFTRADYFWGRPSATTPFPYNGAHSSGSNMGPSNPLFLKQIKERVIALRKASFNPKHRIPVGLVTASGSGLDPEISPYAAYYQIPRIAKTRNLPAATLHQLIRQQITHRSLGLLGEPRINVLTLNLALDQLGKTDDRPST